MMGRTQSSVSGVPERIFSGVVKDIGVVDDTNISTCASRARSDASCSAVRALHAL